MFLTGEQIRAARAMLRMEQAALAEKAGVSVDTVKRLEGVDGPPKAQSGTLQAIRKVFELGGLDLDDGGVRRAADRNTRIIDAFATELGDLIRGGLEMTARRNPQLFDQSAANIVDLLARLLTPQVLGKMVERVLPANRTRKLTD